MINLHSYFCNCSVTQHFLISFKIQEVLGQLKADVFVFIFQNESHFASTNKEQWTCWCCRALSKSSWIYPKIWKLYKSIKFYVSKCHAVLLCNFANIFSHTFIIFFVAGASRNRINSLYRGFFPYKFMYRFCNCRPKCREERKKSLKFESLIYSDTFFD